MIKKEEILLPGFNNVNSGEYDTNNFLQLLTLAFQLLSKAVLYVKLNRQATRCGRKIYSTVCISFNGSSIQAQTITSTTTYI